MDSSAPTSRRRWCGRDTRCAPLFCITRSIPGDGWTIAAQTSRVILKCSPATYVDTNIKGTLNIVQAARELGVGKVIHTSTSEVYGTARFVPITEDHP